MHTLWLGGATENIIMSQDPDGLEEYTIPFEQEITITSAKVSVGSSGITDTLITGSIGSQQLNIEARNQNIVANAGQTLTIQRPPFRKYCVCI